MAFRFETSLSHGRPENAFMVLLASARAWLYDYKSEWVMLKQFVSFAGYGVPQHHTLRRLQ